MEEAFATYLLAGAGMAALIGARADWALRPQASALPALALHKVDGAPVYADEGETGLFSARIQVDCWGATYAAAKGAARLVMARLSGAQFTQGAIEFQSVLNLDEQDSFERGAGAESFYRTRLDFIIWYRET